MFIHHWWTVAPLPWTDRRTFPKDTGDFAFRTRRSPREYPGRRLISARLVYLRRRFVLKNNRCSQSRKTRGYGSRTERVESHWRETHSICLCQLVCPALFDPSEFLHFTVFFVFFKFLKSPALWRRVRRFPITFYTNLNGS